jgi:adenylate kinase
LSARLVKRFDGQIGGLASSDILRRQIAQQTPLGQRVKSIMDSGNFLDDATMSELIASELITKGWVSPVSQTAGITAASMSGGVARHSLSDPISFPPARSRGFSSTSAATAAMAAAGFHSSVLQPQQSWILDGFPRTLAQAQYLDAFLAPQLALLNLVINICVPPAAILSRIASRLIHPASGRVYNLEYNPPRVPGKDDVTGEPLIRRTDDEEIVWRRRVERHEDEVRPLEKWLDAKGLVWRVTGETSDEIYPKIEAEVLRRFGDGAVAVDDLTTAQGVMGVGWEEQELGRLAIKVATM